MSGALTASHVIPDAFYRLYVSRKNAPPDGGSSPVEQPRICRPRIHGFARRVTKPNAHHSRYYATPRYPPDISSRYRATTILRISMYHFGNLIYNNLILYSRVPLGSHATRSQHTHFGLAYAISFKVVSTGSLSREVSSIEVWQAMEPARHVRVEARHERRHRHALADRQCERHNLGELLQAP